MNLYMDKLSGMVPVVKSKNVLLGETGPKAVFAGLEFSLDGDYFEDVPYLQEIERLWSRRRDEEGSRVFLVTEEENIAIKAALSCLIYPLYLAKEEYLEQMEQQGYEGDVKMRLQGADGKAANLRIISMVGERKHDSENNPYMSMATGVEESSIVFFNGLEDNACLEDKLDVITTCKAKLQFVQISKEQIGMPWLRELMMDRSCEVIRIPRVADSYYEWILERLLEEEEYVLDGTITPEQLVRSIRKKCANKFREEDLAWSLDEAVKKAEEEGRDTLRSSDFSLEQTDTESSLHKLQGMIGLADVKQLAMEYAALSREQARNDKIAEVCKNLIFVGNPGSGKTMCGDLLARIMAEEGQSNGSFVVASRKDIIGEYIGHTAPKVAKLFKKARNGVLFVDEAGFFLQEGRGNFSAEAMKEFVRYMELYQDVTVIFALYSDEVEAWMQLDAGLSSRIGRIVKFENYTEEELVAIGERMCEDRGYRMEETAKEPILAYLKNRRAVLGSKFGNAREMRKLTEAAVIAKSVRDFEKKVGEREEVLCKEDFQSAIGRLQTEKQSKKRRIGFVTEAEPENENIFSEKH